MKILVTGGAGFIGSHLVEELVKEGHTVRVLDDFSTGSLNNLSHIQGKVDVMQGDVSNKETCDKAMKGIDIVLHHAALASVQESIKDPRRTWDVNIRGTKLLLNAAVEEKVKLFVMASSAAVYGNNPELPKTETMASKPISPYGESKRMGELLLEQYFKKFKLKTIILRYFNVYGPRQHPHSEYSGVISRFIKTMKKNEQPTIYGNGHQTRDFVYVKDIVRANMCAIKAKKGFGQAYNIGTGHPTSLLDLVRTINSILKKDLSPIFLEPRQGDILESYAEVSKAKKNMGFEHVYHLQEGLKETIENVKE